ncbi:MAG: DNA adenine methylase [Rhizobiaceae bacterium]|nr:DNA adenine methylase [Rhizobiaceae bacterium]
MDIAATGIQNHDTVLKSAERSKRVSGVVIECPPYAKFITRYDKPGTLFYLDPPYWGCENDYGKNIFSRDDFEALATQRKAIKGQFILSINDVPEIRELFDWAKIEAVELNYSIGKSSGKRADELVITG